MAYASRNAGHALGLWILYILTFTIGGGVGAGVTAYLFEAVLDHDFSDALYALIFGVHGFFAFRLAQGLAERAQG
ncbi:MAG: hypothetical protein AAGI71_07545 [Bacteroidota bacterium]